MSKEIQKTSLVTNDREAFYGLEKWVKYTDGESYKKVLSQFAGLIEKYAFDLLGQTSREDEVILTKAMEKEL